MAPARPGGVDTSGGRAAEGRVGGREDAAVAAAAARESSVKVSIDLLCGAVAGSLAKTVIAPLDRTKIIFQTSTVKSFSWAAVGHEMRHIVRNEGLMGLWKGHSATLSRVIPYAGIQFATFNSIKRSVKESRHGMELKWWENLLAGALAGAVSVAATYPLDLMRARMAVDHRSGSLWSNLLCGYREGGVRSLFRGLSPTLLGILPYSGISFACFDALKSAILAHSGNRKLTSVESMVTGAFSGLVAQVTTYPLDIVRRRMQTEGYVPGALTSVKVGSHKYQRVGQTFSLILREEGSRALFKAVQMNAIKGPLAVGISFTTFHWLNGVLTGIEN